MLHDAESHRRLLADDALPTEKVTVPKRTIFIYLRWFFIIATVLLSLALAFAAGFHTARYMSRQPLHPGVVPQIPIGSTSQSFLPHEEFMVPPPVDSTSEPSWDSLLPKGLGYVKNPSIPATENVSTIATFHQLHCLYTLRRIYYSSISGKHGLEAFDNGVDRPSHVAHCFEYLRQALMCCADSSLEPFEAPPGGFPGMGFERECGNFDELKDWAEDWRVMDVESFILDDSLHNHSIAR